MNIAQTLTMNSFTDFQNDPCKTVFLIQQMHEKNILLRKCFQILGTVNERKIFLKSKIISTR